MAEKLAIPPADDALLAPPEAACCAGACGPMFETPLLEQLVNRVRDAVSGRTRPAATQTDRPMAGAEEWTSDD